MLLFPYEHLTIKTRLSADEVRQRLDDNIQPSRLFASWEAGHKPYQGTLTDDQFSVTRIIGYRNSFIPVIKGQIDPRREGSYVRLTMRPHVLVTIFMGLWLLIAGSVGTIGLASLILSVFQSAAPDTSDWRTLLVPIAMVLLGWVIFIGGFKFESIQSKAFFRRIVEAEAVTEAGWGEVFTRIWPPARRAGE